MELPSKQHGVVVAWVRDVELNARDRVELRELIQELFHLESFEEPEPPSTRMRVPGALKSSAASPK